MPTETPQDRDPVLPTGQPRGDGRDAAPPWPPTGRRPVDVRVKSLARLAVTVLALAGAYLLAFEVRFEFRVPPSFRATAWLTLPYVVALKYVVLRLFGVERRSWQFTSLWDMVAVVAAMTTSAVLLVVLRFALPTLAGWVGRDGDVVLPLGVVAADLALSILALAGVRAVRRLHIEQRDIRRRRGGAGPDTIRRVLLIGAGRAGGQVARELTARPDLGLIPVGFLDDAPILHGQRIHGLEVLGGIDRLAQLADVHRIDQAIITISGARGDVLRELTTACRDAGVEARILPGIDALLDGQLELTRLRPVSIEDLLRREPVALDTSSIAEVVAGACVMVTGAGGSIGSELCRQLVRFGPRTLVLVEQAEGPLWAIHRELTGVGVGRSASSPVVEGVEVVPAIGDVCDAPRIAELFTRHRPQLVFHAAAHKHVPMMESNPGEAVKNNVLGTRILADAAVLTGVERFVLISTDKAVNPSSVMGATKRIAERYVQHLAGTSGGVFVSVRFGNVLGSAGSVVPIFEQQIAAGGPITVTHPDMRRYFMTIPEASALVVQAAAVGHPGDVLVLDMGDPVRIADLAHDLIRLSGLRPGVDIAVEYTGIRPGEKLFEELALDSEHTDATAHPSILIARTNGAGRWDTAAEDLAALAEVVASGDEVALRAGIAALVPEMDAAAVEH